MIGRIIKWWKGLPFDADNDKNIWSRREEPLTNKQMFFRDKMATIQTITTLLIIIILFATSVNGYDYFQNVTINSTDTPYSDSFDFAINPIENTTIVFEMVKDDGLVDLVFIDNYTFTNETEPLNITFDWAIDTTIWTENKTLIEEINLTNTENSNIVTLGFQYNVIYQPETLLEINNTDELKVIEGVYNKEISVMSLPNNGSLLFKLQGTPQSNFSFIDCTQFLECPINMFYFDVNGTKMVEIKYDIPRDTAVGSYNSSYKVITDKGNQTVDVVFNIKVPDLFAKPPELPSKCLADVLNFETQLECEGLIQKYRTDLIVEYQNYIANVNTDKICSDYVKYEYVVGDSISEEIMVTNQQLRDENTQLREKLDTKSDIISNLEQKNNELENEVQEITIQKDEEILSNKEANIEKLSKVNKNAEAYVQDFLKEKSKAIKYGAFILFMIPVLLYLGDTYLRAHHFSTIGFKRKYLLIASAIIGTLWVVLLVTI